MSDYRIFRFAHAGVLVALFYAAASNANGTFNEVIWITLSVALPATVFRGLVADHPKERAFKAASGIAGWISYVATIVAFAATFANHSKIAACLFSALSLLAIMILRCRARS
jgi:hypothetical protein